MSKGLAISILTKKPNKGEPEREYEEQEEEMDSLDIPASDLIEAVKSEDVDLVKEALRASYSVCKSEGYDD